MFALAWILTLAAATRVLLVDEVYSIPADQWRYVELGSKQQPALVVAHFDAPQGDSLSASLMRLSDVENLRQGLPHGFVTGVGPGRAGTLRAQVAPGDYVIVLDNQTKGGRAATAHLLVWMDFSTAPAVTVLSRSRQVTVIVISFAVFLAIVGYALRKLWEGARRGAGSGG